MAYEKLFNELYAITVLKYFWSDYLEGFVKWESPDWYNIGADLGIEVSQALLPKDGQEESFLETYLGKHREDIPADAFQRYGQRLYFYNDRLWALLDDGTSLITHKEKILTRFGSKLAKLNTNYRQCEINALYLFAHVEIKKTEAETIAAKLSDIQKTKAHRFDIVFLDCKSAVYILNLTKHNVDTIPIPEKARIFLNNKTETLRRQFPNVTGTPYE